MLATYYVVWPLFLAGSWVIGLGVLAIVLSTFSNEQNARRSPGAWLTAVVATVSIALATFALIELPKAGNRPSASWLWISGTVAILAASALLLYTRTAWTYIGPSKRQRHTSIHRRLMKLQLILGMVVVAFGLLLCLMPLGISLFD